MPCCEVDIQYCQHERNLWRADSSDIHVKHTDNNSNIITINTVLIVLILTSHKGSNSNIITVSKVLIVKGNNSNIITVYKSFTFITNVDLIELIFFPKE